MRAEVTGARAWVRFLVGFAVLWGVLAGVAEVDATGRFGLLVLAAVLAAAVAVERVLDGTPPGVAVRRLGLGRPGGRALLLAVALSGLVLLVHPLTAATTGADVALRSGWPWLLVGIFAFHGVAEELVWRGYAFRRLRSGRSFGRAVAWSMPLLAATHVPVLVSSGPAVGSAAMLVAAVTTVPLAYLFETGRDTVWAPALVHTAIDSFKLVDVESAAQPMYSLTLAAVALVVPLLGLAVPRRVLAPADARTRAAGPGVRRAAAPGGQDRPAPPGALTAHRADGPARVGGPGTSLSWTGSRVGLGVLRPLLAGDPLPAAVVLR
jgi:membrane protease YdiL (CAAX protease family)